MSDISTDSISSTPIVVQVPARGGGGGFLGISGDMWIKIGLMALVVFIIGSIVRAFSGWKGVPSLDNLSKAFGNGTAALAFASEYWYLFMAGFLISPFISAAATWAARKASDAKKSGLSEGAVEVVVDAVVWQAKTEQASREENAEKKAALEKEAASHAERFHDAGEERRTEAEEFMKKNRVEVPPKVAK